MKRPFVGGLFLVLSALFLFSVSPYNTVTNLPHTPDTIKKNVATDFPPDPTVVTPIKTTV